MIQTDEDDCSVADPTFFGDPNATVASPLGPRTSFRCHEFGVQCDDDPEPRAFGVRTGCRSREDSPFMPSVASYVRFLVALKPAPGQVAVTAMFGAFSNPADKRWGTPGYSAAVNDHAAAQCGAAAP